MPFYQQIANGNYVVPPNTAPNAADNTVGGMMMAQFAQRNYTWPANAAQILSDFHNHMQMFWTWDPSQVNGNGAGLLDGTRMSGYCGQLAQAFMALLRTPAPFGFGVQAATAEYQPATEMFLANHPGPVFNLNANVLRHDWDTNGRANAPFYAWGNHIVVSSGGQFYDPCYNATYAALSQMAPYSVSLNSALVNNAIVIESATVTSITGDEYTFQNVQQGSDARNTHRLASLIASEDFPV